MGVLSTTDGGLYACNRTLWAYLDQTWPEIHSTRANFTLRYAGDKITLLIKTDTRSGMVFNPCLQSAMSQLISIQNAMRDWLHRRKTPPRHEAALFLMATLPRDVVGLVVLALQ
jgi:hypothetical protein